MTAGMPRLCGRLRTGCGVSERKARPRLSTSRYRQAGKVARFACIMGSLPRDGRHLARGGCVTTILESYARDLFAYKHVFITGGTSGIGLAASLAFRDLGATVTATGVTEEEVIRAKEDAAHEGISFAQLDVRDGKAVKAAMARYRQLDVVVNAAGMIRRDSEYDPDIFAEVVAVNLVGMMRVCAAAKPRLVASNGAIVNIASMLTFFGGPRVPA